MEHWQLVVSICAGCVTILTALDKFGVFKIFKKAASDHEVIEQLPDSLEKLNNSIKEVERIQNYQNDALLAILRRNLYQCFKDYRDIEAWTDDDCRIQTKMHDAYASLGGNGEESIWWEKKKRWEICDHDEIVERFSLANRTRYHNRSIEMHPPIG